jgi:diguanylate cyclase (GGDEF)-like protein
VSNEAQDTLSRQQNTSRVGWGAAFAALSLAGLSVLAAVVLAYLAPSAPGYQMLLGVAALWLIVLAAYALRTVARANADALQKVADFVARESGEPFDRLYLRMRLAEEQERTNRYGGIATVMAVGLHYLREPSEVEGGKSREEILVGVRDWIARSLRQCDAAGRFEEGQVLVLLPETDRRKARLVADRLRAQSEADGCLLDGLNCFDFVTLQIGIAAYPLNGQTMANVVSAACSAMERAGSLGGNVISVSNQFIASDAVGQVLVSDVRRSAA